MGNRLSNSAVDRYIECSLCYKLHFIDRVRPIKEPSALAFGKALDDGLNILLLEKDLIKAKAKFYNSWKNVEINKKPVDAATSDAIQFSQSDLDKELNSFFDSNGYNDISKYNPSWISLLNKGMLFLETYHKEVLPKIKKVITVQEPVSLKNDDGDEITGILDLIVEWENGKTYLLDNKSSSVKYEENSAKDGQQLPLYYYMVKEKYKLDGIGYIVLSKKINKNRVKTCKVCGKISEGTHKTCPNISDIPNNTRCKGEFDVKINPTVDVQYILNSVEEKDEKRVLDKFDEVNYNVANGYFDSEHNPNKNKFYRYCPYHDYYEGSPNFVKLPKLKVAKEKKS